jgi:hypothetical protein
MGQGATHVGLEINYVMSLLLGNPIFSFARFPVF